MVVVVVVVVLWQGKQRQQDSAGEVLRLLVTHQDVDAFLVAGRFRSSNAACGREEVQGGMQRVEA
jgi:hypothetical protein